LTVRRRDVSMAVAAGKNEFFRGIIRRRTSFKFLLSAGLRLFCFALCCLARAQRFRRGLRQNRFFVGSLLYRSRFSC
jgi:hypothetical protein